MENTFRTKTTDNPDVAQGMNAEALRIILRNTTELQAVATRHGFKVQATIEGKPMDLTEDICDFCGWKNRNGYMGSKEFDTGFVKEVIADFGKIVFGRGNRFKLSTTIIMPS